MNVESYKHKMAKDLLVTWLRENTIDGSGALTPWYWSSNRDGPYCGIWSEYPVCSSGEGFWTWDEQGKKYLKQPPTYRQLAKLKNKPAVIFDIGIIHKGLLQIAIEIVHKNDISEEKLNRVKRLVKSAPTNLSLWSVDAEWLLSQVKKPKAIRCKQVL